MVPVPVGIRGQDTVAAVDLEPPGMLRTSRRSLTRPTVSLDTRLGPEAP